MKKIFIVCFVLLVSVAAKDPSPWFYEIRIYRLADVADETRVDTYLQKALVPALHRIGIKNVGVFKPVKEDTIFNKRMYVLIPYKSLNEFEKTTAAPLWEFAIEQLIAFPAVTKNNWGVHR